MRRRDDVIENFSSFLEIPATSNYDASRWIVDPKLKLSMTKVRETYEDYSIGWWSQYWLKVLGQTEAKPLARYHLLAHLDEICYYTAKSIERKYSKINDWRDCFQVARIEVASLVDKLSQNYDASRGAGVSTYCQRLLNSLVMDKYAEGGARSEAGLLRSLSETKLRRVLKEYGLSNVRQIESHVLAWICFKEIYAPIKSQGGKQIPMPNTEQYQAIAQRYNQLAVNLDLVGGVSGENIQTLLKGCVKAAREATSLKEESLDAKFSDSESSDDAKIFEFLNNLETDQERLEQEQKQQDIKTVLTEAFLSLSIQGQTVLMLCHGLELNQTEVAEKLFGIEQYQLSRKIKGWETTILTSLVKWSSQNLGRSLDLKEINQQAKQIRIWLTPYLHESLYQFLTETVQILPPSDLDLLRLSYIQSVDVFAIAKQTNRSTTQIKQSLARIQIHLGHSLQTHIETTWQVNLQALESTNKKLSNLVQDWLEAEMYKTIR